jgi:hypothetical protein
MKYTIKIICLILTFCTFVFNKAEAKVLPKTAKLIPPQTILLVDIDDFGQLRQQLKKTNVYKLYKDPSMSAVLEDFKTKRQEKLRMLDNEFAQAIVEADILPQGRVAFAFMLHNYTKDANEPPFLFISQWGQNIIKIKDALERIIEKDIEDGAHRKTEDYRDVNITTIIQKPSKAINYCFIDDYIIVSTDLDILKFIIAHIQGAASPTLVNEADYTTTMKAIGPYHDVDFYINIKQIINSDRALDATGEVKSIMTNLGLDNVVSLGGAIGLARGTGGSSSGTVFLKINGPKKGLFKMLDIESAPLRIPQFISASTSSVTIINLDIKKAYDELYNILFSFSPKYAAIMHIPLLPQGPQGEPELQLKTDIIAPLGSQIVIARSINKPISETSRPIETLIAVAINNRSALEKSLSLLYSNLIAANNPDARRELLGHTIYLADFSAFQPAFKLGQRRPMLSQPSAAKKPKLAFTVTDTHLIIANESTVERTIRALSSTDVTSVSSSKWFNTAKSAIPPVVGLAGLEDNVALSEVFWQTLKERKKSAKYKTQDLDIELGIALSSRAPFPYLVFSQTEDFFDFSLLPAFALVRKYFGLTAYYGVSRLDGFFFEFKYFNPSGSD